MNRGIIPEWAEQEALILAFAHEETDWKHCLEEVRECVASIAISASHYAKVYLLCRDEEETRSYFPWIDNIVYIVCDFDDTWMRDCSVLGCFEAGEVVFKGFEFTGWGGKFDAQKDNKLTHILFQKGLYPNFVAVDYILEGGAVESDGRGTILTTASCLQNPNRNAKHDKTSVEKALKDHLGAQQVLWLENGYLRGDDTDGHIDMLARFCNETTIAYVGLPSKEDEHYESFLAMQTELQAFRDCEGKAYNLVGLPFVPAIFEDNERLPASYANFLILNGAVLVPTYGVSEDYEALDIIENIFPDKNVLGIDCRVLIKEHGSLHCMSMQLAKAGF